MPLIDSSNQAIYLSLVSERPPKTREEGLETDRRIIITDSDFPPADFPSGAKKPRAAEFKSLSESLSKLIKHFVITVSVVGLGVLTHLILVYWFADPRFFDLIPVRYTIDAGDIAVIATFFIIMIRELWRQKE